METTIKGNDVTTGSVVTDIIARVEEETPPFFKRIRTWAKWTLYITGGLAAGISSIISAGVAIPIWIPIVIGAITAISTGVIGTASMTTSNKEILSRPSNELVKK